MIRLSMNNKFNIYICYTRSRWRWAGVCASLLSSLWKLHSAAFLGQQKSSQWHPWVSCQCTPAWSSSSGGPEQCASPALPLCGLKWNKQKFGLPQLIEDQWVLSRVATSLKHCSAYSPTHIRGPKPNGSAANLLWDVWWASFSHRSGLKTSGSGNRSGSLPCAMRGIKIVV